MVVESACEKSQRPRARVFVERVSKQWSLPNLGMWDRQGRGKLWDQGWPRKQAEDLDLVSKAARNSCLITRTQRDK